MMQRRYIKRITHEFPYPIVTHFIKLRTDECLEAGSLRLEYLLKTSEAITRYLGIIVISECRELAEQHPEWICDFPLPLAQQIKRPAWGTWLGFIREGLRWLQQHNAALLMPELHDFYFTGKLKPTPAAKAMEQALVLRNALSHHKIEAMLQHEFVALCDEIYALLTTVLEALEFLVDYPLSFVNQIEVQKNRTQDANFYHRFKSIMGESEEFYGERDNLDFYMDTKATVLLNPDSKKFLNLDPLLVYEEAAGKAKDVFFYNGMSSPTTAHYIACKHGKAFKSSDSIRGELLTQELQQLLVLFPAKSSDKTEEVV